MDLSRFTCLIIDCVRAVNSFALAISATKGGVCRQPLCIIHCSTQALCSLARTELRMLLITPWQPGCQYSQGGLGLNQIDLNHDLN